ncbi:nucleic-acid-binding protein from mobile element jockey [Plakobranchus ocellatus]|uniref:Nucleic-acid-binding protein from mobile element jockey n=1 Tax=Plakobranchus ocellatus TaxID=259542 RepID=A0AAV4DWJ4_9GAST|nr:nucleic-acid-binding protein from mobile element jockey [Plakobranchus ocellatus]
MVEELSSVTHARCIKVRRGEDKILTDTVVLTFDSPKPPSRIRAGYLTLDVRLYAPLPMRCYKCQRYGHSKEVPAKRRAEKSKRQEVPRESFNRFAPLDMDAENTISLIWKTTCVYFHSQRIYTEPALHLDGQPIPVKGEAKFLRVIFDSKLNVDSRI